MGRVSRLNFYARVRDGYREPLSDHLKDVSQRAKDYLANLPVPDLERLVQLVEIMGLTHDFGKYTSFFQDHLFGIGPSDAKSHHAFISAVFCAYVVEQRFPQDEEGKLLSYLAVARHHGILVNPKQILFSSKERQGWPELSTLDKTSLRREALACQEQIKDLMLEPRYSAVLAEQNALGLTETKSFLEDEDAVPKLLKSMFSLIRKWRRDNEEAFGRRYWHALLLFSALIDADKHASAATTLITRDQEPESLIHAIDMSVKSKPRGEGIMQEVRDRLRQASLDASDQPLKELYPGLLSMSAPTGSGKTLAVMAFASRLRKQVKEQKGYMPRIIYALPFVNIIEQNYDVIEEALKILPAYQQNPSAYLLKHHHLANLAFQGGDEKKEVDEALLLTESWESEITVTTFVQLFHTLIGYQNRTLKKLHNIAGNIIILDEIQSVNFEYWSLFRYILTTLTEHLGCTVIQMTATQPRILLDTKQLVSEETKMQMFTGLERTRLEPNLKTSINIGQLARQIEEIYDTKESLLVVVNTIKTAVELYEAVKKQLKSKIKGFHEFERDVNWKNKTPIVHLSTNITPWQRRKRVEFLENFMEPVAIGGRGGKPIVISTQVIEAGVDLDFDSVIRDIGPLDSIVQVAGRCNRHGDSQTRGVKIVKLVREGSSQGDATLVYGKVLPQESEKLLESPLLENEMYKYVETYFEAVEAKGSQQKSKDLLKALRELNFSDPDNIGVDKFRLIEETDTYPVFVELNLRATRLSTMLISAAEKIRNLERNDPKHKKLRFQIKSLWRRLGMYVISPTGYRLRQNMPDKYLHPYLEEYFHIPNGEVDVDPPIFYDIETGFIWTQGTAIY